MNPQTKKAASEIMDAIRAARLSGEKTVAYLDICPTHPLWRHIVRSGRFYQGELGGHYWSYWEQGQQITVSVVNIRPPEGGWRLVTE